VDADALFDLHSSAHVLRYWDAPPWSECTRAERFIAACQQMANEGTGARLAMDRLSDGAFIGWSSLTRWNPDYRSASLGYCLHDVKAGPTGGPDCPYAGTIGGFEPAYGAGRQ